jgi:hypothetical protein
MWSLVFSKSVACVRNVLQSCTHVIVIVRPVKRIVDAVLFTEAL